MAGQQPEATSVAVRLEQTAQAYPGFPGLVSAALHARALADHDPERAVAAAHSYEGDPRPLVRAAALEDASRVLPQRPKDEAVSYLDEALALQSAAGAERGAAPIRRMLRDRGVLRASGRPAPAAARGPGRAPAGGAGVRLVTQGATDREVAERLFISVHTVNSHLSACHARNRYRHAGRPGDYSHLHRPGDRVAAKSHVIELASQTVLFDVPLTAGYAREVLAVAASLGKPVTRLYISHAHPDHFATAALVGAPSYALAPVKDLIDRSGDVRIQRGYACTPDHAGVPLPASRPVDRAMAAGEEETLDGARLRFEAVGQAETDTQLAVALPDAGVLITQDVLCNGVHLFLGEHAFEAWQAAITRLDALPYGVIIPGHGLPRGGGAAGRPRHLRR